MSDLSDRTARWEGFWNARDLGGLPTVTGAATRYGALIRSADPRLVTAAGWQAALGAGFRTVIDLRNDDEVQPGPARRPPGLRTLRIPLDDIGDAALWRRLNEQGLNGTPLYFRPFLAARPQRVAAVLTAVARAGPGGIIFHCGAGRDRSGLVAVMIRALAGVVPEAIAADYELSLSQPEPLRAAPGVTPPEPSMRAVLRDRGTTVSGAVRDFLDGLDAARYLAAAGFGAADISALRRRLR
jgi:protein-tyrosine phosphatase